MALDTKGGVETFSTMLNRSTNPRQGLAIHCSLGHCGAWAEVAQRLSDQISVLGFDMPGHGRSAPWDAALGDFQEVTVGMAVDLLGDQGPRDILGHSFGATVALRLAAERPDLVRSLTLVEPVFFAVAWHDDPALARQHEADFADFEAAIARGEYHLAARLFTDAWGDGGDWDTIPKDKQDFMASQMPLIVAESDSIYHDPAGLISDHRIEALIPPVLLLEGGKSPVYIDAINTALARRLPNCRRHVVPGAGHMLPLTHAPQVAAHISDFLNSVPVQGAPG